MKATSQKEARQKGLSTYETGRPCRRGHIAYRYTQSGNCSQCSLEYSREWQKQNYSLFRRNNENYRRKRKYNLSPEDFSNMFENQKGVCKTCEKPLIGRDLCIDHDHSNGRVRGLLCHHCNTALGRVNDNPTVLRRLADYLEEKL